MTRTAAGAIVVGAIVAGLALRLARLDARPMHHDEANQAVKLGTLLEHGEYRYDPREHHGPTLYDFTLPAAAWRGQHTFASLDERTLRGVTVAFGTATILLLPLLSAGIDRTAAAAAAVLTAVSPAMTFYSRMYIQEPLFACFALAFVIAVGRAVQGGSLGWAAAAGVAAGLLVATKETWIIVVPAALASCALAWRTTRSMGRVRDDRASRSGGVAAAVGVGCAVLVAGLFYSRFLAAPAGVFEPLQALGTYVGRGVAPSAHQQPWSYYLHLLAWSSAGGLRWSEGFVLVLAVAGAIAAWPGRDHERPERVFWARHLAGYTLLGAAVYSALPYKTPWNLLPFYVGALALAGIGVSTLLDLSSARSANAPSRASRTTRAALVAAFVVASAHLGWQAWRASVTYATDSRNPYVYAQTLPDAVRLATRIRALAAVHPDGDRMLVAVVAPPEEQWPLPWYLRAMPRVGYWTTASDALASGAPVVVASVEHEAAVEAALGDRYVTEFRGLRPDVLLALHVEVGLWQRFLDRAATRGPAPASVP